MSRDGFANPAVRVCVCVRLRAPIRSLSTVAVSRVRAAFRDGAPA